MLKQAAGILIVHPKLTAIFQMLTAQERLVGCSKWSSFSVAARKEANPSSVPYVEHISDARTTLTDFFGILLG